MIAFLFLFVTLGRLYRDMMKQPESRALAITASVLVLAGVLFYTRVEKWTVLNAFYFCIVTLATVGYGDITPTTDAGKIFTMLYIVVGIAIIGGFFATLGKLIRPGRLLERGERDLQKGERDLTRDLPLGGGGQPTKNSPDQSTEEEKPQ